MPAPRSLIRYIREASRLRHAIRLSEIDEHFANAGGHVHYILDTNVVGMFMRPADHIRQLGMFSNWLDPETLTATATLTSEFLLSKQLPGQRGECATLSPDHYEEVNGLADRAMMALSELDEEEIDLSVQAMQRSGTRLDELAATIRDSQVSPHNKFDALTAILPKEVASLVQGPVAELLQLKRAFGADCIYRIDGMPWFHESALKANIGQEVEWYRRIHNARSEGPRSEDLVDRDHRPPKETTFNELRDARTMSLIIELTKEFAESDHRFLFVTADGAIRRAVESFVLENRAGSGSGGLDVFIRHPREFVPLLNLGNISGDDELRSIFDTLKVTLDELLTGIPHPEEMGTVYIEPTDDEIEGSLALGGGASGGSNAPASSTEAQDKLDELQDLWCRACRSALSLGLGLLKKRDEALFGGIADVITAPDIKSHIQENIVDALGDLLRDHAGLNVIGAFSAVRSLDSRRKKRGLSPEKRVLRVPLHLVDQGVFGEFLGSRTLNDYLLDIARGGEFHEQADHLANRGRDPIAYLFISCICLAVGLWEPAKDFAKRALAMIQNIHSRTGVSTARYIFAVAHRMSLSMRKEVKDAEQVLEKSIKDHGERADEALLALRARSELAALRLAAVEQTLYAMSAPDDERPSLLLKPREIEAYLKHVGSALATVIHALEENFPDRVAELAGFLVQAYANAAAFSTITKLVPDYRHARSSLDLHDEELVTGFENALGMVSAPSPIIKVYLQVLRATSALGHHDMESLRQSALKELADVRMMKLVLPRMDIEVAEFLTDKLRPAAVA